MPTGDQNHKFKKLERDKKIIDYYKSSQSLRKTAEEFNITFQRVHQILKQNNI